MNSKEALAKLLKDNENARERFKKLGDIPREDVDRELKKFQKEFGIELRKEDFAVQEIDNKQLEGVAGGAGGGSGGGAGAMDLIGLGFDIYGLLNRPDDTRRGTKGGSKRFT